MNSVQPNNSEAQVTLKQASEILGVSIETLLSWNQHNILKPIITSEGAIVYTRQQITHFLTIRQAAPKNEPIPAFIQTTVSPIATQGGPAPQIQQVVQPQIHQEEPVHDDFADVFRKSDIRIPSKSNSPRHPSSKIMITFAAVLVMVAVAVLPQLVTPLPGQNQLTKQNLGEDKFGVHTSTFDLSKEIIAILPLQLQNQIAQKKVLHNESENISKEKIVAPSLYKSLQTENTLATNFQNQKPGVGSKSSEADLMETVLGDSEALASAGFFDTCSNCDENKNSAIDESGTIKGETNKDTLATIVGGIDAVVKGDSLQQTTTSTTYELLLLSLALLAVLLVFQSQFAYAGGKPAFVPLTPYKQPEISFQKALEIEQKTDGTVVLVFQGKEYKISKPEMNSESDQFIERLMTLTKPNLKEIEYDTAMQDAIRSTTPLSRLVTRLGFVGMKRDLFFPRTSKNSVLFRRYLTKGDLARMNLTTDQILNELKPLS